jgi:hypothetical protein
MIIIPAITVKPGYQPQAEDNGVESDAVQFYLLRQRTLSQRLAMAAKLSKGAKSLAFWGIRQAHPQANWPEIRQIFARAVLAEKWTSGLNVTGEDEQVWIQDSIELAQQLHPILTTLQIPYYITGGVASAAYGEPRTTRDLDLVVQLDRADITRLSQPLEQAGFYCPPGAIVEIQRGMANVLSVTHMQSILNADIIINADTAFDQAKMSRRRLVQLDPGTPFWLMTPEDLILAKLIWGKRSQSEKQWRDVLGVLKVQQINLDYGYLAEWGDRLNLEDDLRRALTAAGI